MNPAKYILLFFALIMPCLCLLGDNQKVVDDVYYMPQTQQPSLSSFKPKYNKHAKEIVFIIPDDNEGNITNDQHHSLSTDSLQSYPTPNDTIPHL